MLQNYRLYPDFGFATATQNVNVWLFLHFSRIEAYAVAFDQFERHASFAMILASSVPMDRAGGNS